MEGSRGYGGGDLRERYASAVASGGWSTSESPTTFRYAVDQCT